MLCDKYIYTCMSACVCVHIIHAKENGSQRPPFWCQFRLPGFARWRPYLGENDCHHLSSYTFWQKIGQRNQESIRNHLGNSETIGSWLQLLRTYWLWDQRQGSENRRNYPFLAVLGIRKPVWTVSLHLACHHGLLIFLRDRFIYVHITPYTVSIGVLIGDLASNFRFLRQLHTCPETNPLFTGRRHSWSAVALTASCEPAVISSPARINDSKWTCPWLHWSHCQNLHWLLLLLADCSGYHPSNPRLISDIAIALYPVPDAAPRHPSSRVRSVVSPCKLSAAPQFSTVHESMINMKKSTQELMTHSYSS